MTYGMLALFEDMPELSRMIIDRAVDGMKMAMGEYAPDGAYPEGYIYWYYGTGFNVMFLAAIEKIWKTDYALLQLPGFLKTGEYIAHMIGATGNCFNYADSGQGGGLFSAMFWFANKTNDKSILWDQRKYIESYKSFTSDRLAPMYLILGSNIRLADVKPPAELMWVGRGIVPVALMRTSWSDPNAIYVGIKGSNPRGWHCHMDAGSFVMEADGVRWAMDFGAENYTAMEASEAKGAKGLNIWDYSQNGQRWKVFRYNNFAHNTLSVNGQLHRVDGIANMDTYSTTPDFMNAVSDLSAIFKGELAECVRGIAIVDKQYVVVRDELKTSDKEATVRWTLLTPAEAKITGKNTIELKKDGKKLKIEVAEPAKVSMKTWSTTPPNDFENPNTGTKLVGFEVKIPANTSATLLVKLIPQSAKSTSNKIPELKKW